MDVMFRRFLELVFWMGSGLGWIIGWGGVLFAPLYFFYLYLSCDPSGSKRALTGLTTYEITMSKQTVRPCQETDEGQVYRWTETDTEYVYMKNGREMHGTFRDDAIPVGTKSTLYVTADGKELQEHPQAYLVKYEEGVDWALYSLFLPCLSTVVLVHLFYPVYKRFKFTTDAYARFSGAPSRVSLFRT